MRYLIAALVLCAVARPSAACSEPELDGKRLSPGDTENGGTLPSHPSLYYLRNGRAMKIWADTGGAPVAFKEVELGGDAVRVEFEIDHGPLHVTTASWFELPEVYGEKYDYNVVASFKPEHASTATPFETYCWGDLISVESQAALLQVESDDELMYSSYPGGITPRSRIIGLYSDGSSAVLWDPRWAIEARATRRRWALLALMLVSGLSLWSIRRVTCAL